ncbi:MAG: sulfur carrier protein ThiS [Clostridium sp.]|uniref:sulfur carrier protein ThiS n=1 Tax=Clostridium sp. TaxID=1506 RepID=UPI00302DA9B2
MILNGKNVELENEITIDELLSIYKIDNSRVVVELNMEIISKDDYKKIKVKSKDTIEVISFVGGG